MTGQVVSRTQSLIAVDAAHLVHPQQSDEDQQHAIVIDHGKGCTLWDVDGNRFFDGLSGLWNVNVGHGRVELAEAAAAQMSKLAFASAYAGLTNEPAIALAERLAGHAPEGMSTLFFTTGGAESNESAFKTARYFWNRRGKPEKIKILSRQNGYHGVTMGAMAATGLPLFWERFGPLPPGFGQVPAMSPEALEARIIQEGPETVAAFIGEPVQGAGGVYPPAVDYWPRIRAICNRYDVLLIADEVITGFGRTGRFWAMQHWNVVPDMLCFAKGVTSGYLPLGGVFFSDAIRDTMRAADAKWMHAYTYSGHPVCCAVGLRNLDIIEQEHLVRHAHVRGEQLQHAFSALARRDDVVEARGLGMMAAVEFRAERQVGGAIVAEARRRGLITRFRNNIVMLAPPLVTTEEELHEMLGILNTAISVVTGK